MRTRELEKKCNLERAIALKKTPFAVELRFAALFDKLPEYDHQRAVESLHPHRKW